jgi:hypothetical protein
LPDVGKCGTHAIFQRDQRVIIPSADAHLIVPWVAYICPMLANVGPMPLSHMKLNFAAEQND